MTARKWHLDDKAEEMRMRVLGKTPRCLHCEYFIEEHSGDWCSRYPQSPNTLVSQPNGDGTYYCPNFVEKRPCLDSISPPSI